jgi:hypothetical protein
MGANGAGWQGEEEGKEWDCISGVRFFFLSLERANHRASERGWLMCMVFWSFFLASESFVLFPG